MVQDNSGKTVATLFGKWDESMHFVNGDFSCKGKGFDEVSEARLLWNRSKPPKFPTRYNFTRFGITLNELTPELKVIFLMSHFSTFMNISLNYSVLIVLLRIMSLKCFLFPLVIIYF